MKQVEEERTSEDVQGVGDKWVMASAVFTRDSGSKSEGPRVRSACMLESMNPSTHSRNKFNVS
jgi:hypothetical protein